MTTKFSQFPQGGNIRVGDKVAGLRDGENTQFNMPGTGIEDANGNFLVAYSAADDAVNYVQYTNADTGDSPIMEAKGQDATVGLNVNSKGNGSFRLNLGTGDLVVNDSVGINEISDDDTFADASDEMVSTSLAVKDYVASQVAPLADATFITKTDETADFPSSIPLSGMASGFLSNTTATGVLNSRTITGTANQITATNGDGVSANPTLSLPSTLIAPGTLQATTSLNVGGAGATVTSISTDGTLAANSDTLTLTQKAVKTYADTADTAIKSYNYITKTDNTANLPNSIPLSGIATGFLSNTTTTGVLNSRTVTGTSNQIDVTNGTGASGNPTLALSSTMVTPGTFTIGTGYVVNNVSNSGSTVLDTDIMTAYAVQSAISAAIDAGISFRGGWDASGGLYPTTGGTGVAGAVEQGNWWYVTVAGTLGGTALQIGDWFIALTNTPGQTAANWLNFREGVNSVFNRQGAVVAVSGDYTFSQITGLPATAGTSGALMQSTGTAFTTTTATYPSTAGTASTILQSNGTDIVNSTARYPGTASTSGTFLQADGTNWGASAMTVPTSAGSAGKIWRSDGTNVSLSTSTFPDTYTAGDILYCSATNVLSKLAIGSPGQILTVIGGIPAWSAPGATMTLIDTQTFTAGGTWTKPANTNYVDVLIIGGGGGGGSGCCGAAATNRLGGNSGNGGAFMYIRSIPAGNLSATEAVTVGTGGTGGALVTSAGSVAGNAGADGGASTFFLYQAIGGFGGAGGLTGASSQPFNNSGVTALVSGLINFNEAALDLPYRDQTGLATLTDSQALVQQSMAIQNSNGNITSTGATSSLPFPYEIGKTVPVAGSPGGSINTSNGATPNSSFTILGRTYSSITGPVYINIASVNAAIGFTAGSATTGNNGGTYNTYYGIGGSGGYSNPAGNAYAGGNGGNYGGGGGGGGACVSNFNSGAGGNGAGGLVVVFSYS